MKVVLLDYDWENLDLEKEFFAQHGFEFEAHNCTSEEEVVAVAHDADGVIAEYAPLGPYSIPRLSRCKIIACNATGFDNVDLKVAEEHGIWVTNVPGYCTAEVADHTLALILAWSKKICIHHTLVKSGIWDFKAGGKVYRLEGKVLGLIGCGRIGNAVAQRARSFGMHVIVFDPYIDMSKTADQGYQLVDNLDELLHQADIISLHTPLNENTRGIISDAEFEKMKSGVAIINVARGGLIDEAALLRALDGGKVSFAGLDVLAAEPPRGISLSLATHPKVITTPHAAFYSEDSVIEVRTRAAKEVVRVLTGQEPQCPVNKPIITRQG